MDKTRQPVTAIVFDWAGVFCSPGEPFSHVKLRELTGLSIEEMSKATKEVQQHYYRGKISTDEFWQHIIRHFNIPLTAAELSAAYLASYSIYPEMLELAKRVRTRLKTALLSNLTSEMMHEIIKTHQIDRYFDHVLFSNEIGYMKPETESFAAALERLGTKPQETLFIDDGLENVEAAQALGFQTMLFTSKEQCAGELSSLVGFSA